MNYDKAFMYDTRENELCETCRFKALCNKSNKTLAPSLTALACNVALIDALATDLKQVNGKIVATKNNVRHSQAMVYSYQFLQRLATPAELVDTPHVNDKLQQAVFGYLRAYYNTPDGKTFNRAQPEKRNEDGTRESVISPLDNFRARHGKPPVENAENPPIL